MDDQDSRILKGMRDYSVRTPRRQPTRSRPKHVASHHTSVRHASYDQSGWLAWLQTAFQSLGKSVGLSVGAGVIGLLLIWVLKSNVYQLIPLAQPTTIVFLDPAAGNQTDLLVMQLASESRKVLLYRIKNDTQTQLFSGYGTYQLGSIYPLLQLDNKTDHYIRATVGAVLGVMVDEVVPVSGMSEKLDYQKLAKRPQETATTFMRPLWWQSTPGVSWKTRLQWLTYLEQLDVTWVADVGSGQEVADLKLEPKYSQLKNCSLAVVNTTVLKGLARRISNVFENSGLTVIRTAAEQLLEPESVILYDPDFEHCQPLVSYLQQALPSFREARADQNLANRFRANVVVILGQDLIDNVDQSAKF